MPRDKRSKEPVPAVGGEALIDVEERVELKTDPSPPPAPSPKAKPKTARVVPAGVRLEVFLRLAGRKPDQLAGFAAHARLEKLGLMPVSDWRVALRNFDHRPTK